MTISQRMKAPTPFFFKRIRNIGLTMAGISAAVLTAPVTLPPIVLTVAGYIGVAGTVASIVSQSATDARKKAVKRPKRHGR